MKSNLQDAVAFLATAIWSNGFYAEEEKETLGEIAMAIEVDAEELAKEIDKAVTSLEDKSEEEVNEYLIDHASQIEEEDAEMLMQCAIEIVLADQVIERDEAQVLFDLADATGYLSNTDVLLMVADMVKYDPDIEVKF